MHWTASYPAQQLRNQMLRGVLVRRKTGNPAVAEVPENGWALVSCAEECSHILWLTTCGKHIQVCRCSRCPASFHLNWGRGIIFQFNFQVVAGTQVARVTTLGETSALDGLATVETEVLVGALGTFCAIPVETNICEPKSKGSPLQALKNQAERRQLQWLQPISWLKKSYRQHLQAQVTTLNYFVCPYSWCISNVEFTKLDQLF